ncbi:hypothetical protein Tco_1197342 [Tanacetum coccineum]
MATSDLVFDECGWDAETSPRTRHPAFSSLYQLIQSFSFDAPGLFRLRANCASSSVKTKPDIFLGNLILDY